MCSDDAQVRRIIKMMNVPLSPLAWALAIRLLEVMQKPMSARKRAVVLAKISCALGASSEDYRAA